MMNVPSVWPAGIELVSTHAQLTTLVVQMLNVPLTVIGQCANVLLVSQEIHTADVYLVS